MPHEIELDLAPGGYALTNAREGEKPVVQHTGFISSEDGQDFIARLEGLPDDILKRLPSGRWPIQSQIDHMLVIVRPDNKATVYVNELGITAKVRPSRNVESGEPMVKDDIADFVSVEFNGVTIPDDAGVMFIFSKGWRKGFFFDLAPVGPDHPRRTFDLNVLLGQLYSHVLFQERFAILESEWERIFSEKWFLFVGLSDAVARKMVSFVRAGWAIDDMAAEIVEEVKKKASAFLAAWRRHPTFSNHIPILDRAIERFLAGDPMSCSGLLFPRIEGLMRSNHFGGGETAKPNAKNLSVSAVQANVHRAKCRFLPRKFCDYLEKVYFANFEPTDPIPDISRHTVGHGVAEASAFGQKSAAIAILVTQQLFYCFEKPIAGA